MGSKGRKPIRRRRCINNIKGSKGLRKSTAVTPFNPRGCLWSRPAPSAGHTSLEHCRLSDRLQGGRRCRHADPTTTGWGIYTTERLGGDLHHITTGWRIYTPERLGGGSTPQNDWVGDLHRTIGWGSTPQNDWVGIYTTERLGGGSTQNDWVGIYTPERLGGGSTPQKDWVRGSTPQKDWVGRSTPQND